VSRRTFESRTQVRTTVSVLAFSLKLRGICQRGGYGHRAEVIPTD
jgi:hypothetical protein